MKDRFSSYASAYAMFRPAYPTALIEFIVGQCSHRDDAWDCGTGNGQVASRLSGYFQHVHATDISEQQLSNAEPAPNIIYEKRQAEYSGFRENSFDLITVGQALHWFDTPSFYKEVRRVARPGAVFGAFGYSPLRSDPKFDALLHDFYYNVIYAYWDAERKLVDDEYRSLDFPFEEISVPSFRMEFDWTPAQVHGYITTWSAVQKYISTHGHNPVDELMEALKPCWSAEKLHIYFPIFMRLGIVN